MADVHGSCDDRFAGVREALAQHLDADELGASVAVDLDGRTVVDLWGGFRDPERTAPWTEDTIVNVWSTTKCVLSLAALMLVDQGELDLDAPVGDYWPEFSAKGKKNVLVRHLMAHTSGVPAWEPPFSIRDMYDWETACERLTQQRPWWEPGTVSGYHAANQGHLVGEVIRRITGKTFQRFVAEEIAGPLGADFQVGCAEKDWERVATLVPPPRPEPDPDVDLTSVARRTFTGPVMSTKATMSREWREADLGALNGHSNARGVLGVLRVLTLGGEADGVRLLSPKTIDRIFDVQADGVDLVLEAPFRFGIGYALTPTPSMPYLPAGRVAFWGGWGGSMAVMDLDRRLTITYAMNRMASSLIGSERSEAYIRAVYAGLERQHR
jgi:CubicO group peptidase (beta-lactamase class C family)